MGSKKRRFADDGWALWIDGDDRSTIYLNEWINPKGKSYVDISVRVYGAKEAKAVNFFVPFEVERKEITDLSYMLADSSALRALFNTNGKVDSEKYGYSIRINEARLLPPEINEIKDLQEQRIRKALVTIW